MTTLHLTETERVLLEDLLHYASAHFECDDAASGAAFVDVVLGLLAKVQSPGAMDAALALMALAPVNTQTH